MKKIPTPPFAFLLHQLPLLLRALAVALAQQALQRKKKKKKGEEAKAEARPCYPWAEAPRQQQQLLLPHRRLLVVHAHARLPCPQPRRARGCA